MRSLSVKLEGRRSKWKTLGQKQRESKLESTAGLQSSSSSSGSHLSHEFQFSSPRFSSPPPLLSAQCTGRASAVRPRGQPLPLPLAIPIYALHCPRSSGGGPGRRWTVSGDGRRHQGMFGSRQIWNSGLELEGFYTGLAAIVQIDLAFITALLCSLHSLPPSLCSSLLLPAERQPTCRPLSASHSESPGVADRTIARDSS